MISKELSVLVVDDHELVREGLKNVVGKLEMVKEVHDAGNGKEALRFLKSNACDLVLMDLQMPEMDGMDASREILKNYPQTKILVLSGFNDDSLIYHLVELGVHGFLEKNTTIDQLNGALQDVIDKGFHYNESVVTAMRKGIVRHSDKPLFYPQVELTEREREVLKLLCQEKTTKEIGNIIALSERTVEKIRAHLSSKLKVKGTAGLVRYAVEKGLHI